VEPPQAVLLGPTQAVTARQQLGLERIGQIYAVSRHTVTHLAHRYGVALRQPGRPYRV